MPPTAQAFVADVAATALKTALPPWMGVATWVQDVPSQCSARVCDGFHHEVPPTAQASLAETADTPRKYPTGWSYDTAQLLPFQCMISDEVGVRPTAQTSRAEVPATPYKRSATHRYESEEGQCGGGPLPLPEPAESADDAPTLAKMATARATGMTNTASNGRFMVITSLNLAAHG